MKREFAALVGTAFLISRNSLPADGLVCYGLDPRRDWCSCRMEERLQNPRTY